MDIKIVWRIMMKKILAGILAVVLCFGMAGCASEEKEISSESESSISSSESTPSIDESSEKEVADQLEKDGYILPEYEKFNSPAEENGLGDTKIYVFGSIEEVVEYDDNIALIISADEGKWLVPINTKINVNVTEMEKLKGLRGCWTGIYVGFSEKMKLPTFVLVMADVGDQKLTGIGAAMLTEATPAPIPSAEDAPESSGTVTFISKTFGSVMYEVPQNWEEVVKEDSITYYPPPIDGKTIVVTILEQDNPGVALKGNESAYFGGYEKALTGYVAGDTKTIDATTVGGMTYTLSAHSCTFTQDGITYQGVFSVYDTGAKFISFSIARPLGYDTDDIYEQYTNMLTSCCFDKNTESSDKPSGTSSASSDAVSSIGEIKPSQQTYNFFDINSDGMYGAYAVEITNTYKSAIVISNCVVDFIDVDGKIIKHEENYNVMPCVLAPGEKAYLGDLVSVDSITDPEVIKEMRVKLIAKETTGRVKTPEFSNLNPMINSLDEIEVTGEVNNTTGADIQFLPISVVLFGEDDKLLAVNFAYVNDLLNGDIMSFDTSFWDNTITLDAIKRVEAYGCDSSLALDLYYE